MKVRGPHFRWFVLTLLLVLVGGSWAILQGNRPRVEQYVMKGYGGYGGHVSYSRVGITFVCPGGFRVQRTEDYPAVTHLERTPLTGVPAWIEERLPKPQVTYGDEVVFWISYRDDADGIDETERQLVTAPDYAYASIRRLRSRIGPALVGDMRGLGANGKSVRRELLIFPDVPVATGSGSPLHPCIEIDYYSPARIESQLRQAVDEVVSNTQIITL